MASPLALPRPTLRHVFRLRAELAAPLEVGEEPAGRRRLIPFGEGSFSGALILVRSDGVRHGAPEVMARLGRGEEVAPGEYTFRVAIRMETADPGLAWLNDGVFIGVGAREATAVVYDVHLVE